MYNRERLNHISSVELESLLGNSTTVLDSSLEMTLKNNEQPIFQRVNACTLLFENCRRPFFNIKHVSKQAITSSWKQTPGNTRKSLEDLTIEYVFVKFETTLCTIDEELSTPMRNLQMKIRS